jgi:hypothetical protein
MLITTLKSLLQTKSAVDTITMLLNSYKSHQIAYLTTQFPSGTNEDIRFVYLCVDTIFPTYLCNLSDCYPNLDALIVKTTKVEIAKLIHKYRITILLTDDKNHYIAHENCRQITIYI